MCHARVYVRSFFVPTHERIETLTGFLIRTRVLTAAGWFQCSVGLLGSLGKSSIRPSWFSRYRLHHSRRFLSVWGFRVHRITAVRNCVLRVVRGICVGFWRAVGGVKLPYLKRLLRCKSPCSFRGQFCLGSLLVSDRGAFLHWEEVSSCPTFNIQISDAKRGRAKGDVRCKR